MVTLKENLEVMGGFLVKLATFLHFETVIGFLCTCDFGEEVYPA